MRRRHTLAVVALLATALFGPAGCSVSAKPAQPAFWCKYHLQMMQGRITVQP